MEILKYKNDGSAVAYPKLYKDNNMSVTSTFYRAATKGEIKKDSASQERPIISVEATDYIRVPIEVVAGIKVVGVYVASNMETIRLRATEVLIYCKLPREDATSSKGSVFTDFEIEPIEDEDEDDASE